MNDSVIALAAFVGVLAGILLFTDIGYRIGRRQRAREPGVSSDGIGTVDAAVFGLLGLALAFTYSGASDRLALRRAQIVQEANAIGTAYLRVDVLPGADQPPVRDLYRRYLEARIEVFDQFLDRPASQAALDRAGALQREIWKRSVAACERAANPGTCLLVLPPLNDMIDITTTRTMATLTHVPAIILVLLVLLSLLGALLSGHTMSAQPRRDPLHMMVFALAVSLTIYVVIDLEDPRAGLITLTSADQAMVQLRETMK